MTDISELMENLQSFLISAHESVIFVGCGRGSDQWDDIAELAFDIFIAQPVRERYGISISNEYEVWPEDINEYNLKVEVTPHAAFFWAPRTGPSEVICYQEKESRDTPVEFGFIGFGSPFASASDGEALNHVQGLGEEGDSYCVRKESCRFYVTAPYRGLKPV